MPPQAGWEMKKSRFSEEQIVKLLRESERTSVAAVAKANGIVEQTIYNWRKQYGTSTVDEVREMKRLTQENARLKKLLAERDLEIEVMKELAKKKW